MTKTPCPRVDAELRREIFLGLADLVSETRTKATTLARWYGDTYFDCMTYTNRFVDREYDQLWGTLSRHSGAAVTTATTYTEHAPLDAVVATLIATPGAIADSDDAASVMYQFFVQAAVYGREYYARTGYNPDSFLPGQYLFLALCFDATMRSALTEALGDNVS